MSVSPVGLLVIHGIGSQRPGDLCCDVASSLADTNTYQRDDAAPHGLQRANVGGGPVIIAEANWSELSSPDNPPVVRSPFPVFKDFVETVLAAWRESYLVRVDRYHIVAIAIVVLTAVAAAEILWPGTLQGHDGLVAVLGALWFGLLVYHGVCAVRERLKSLARASRSRRLLEGAAALGVSFFTFFPRTLWMPSIGASALVFLSVAVLTTTVGVSIMGAAVWIFLCVGAAFKFLNAARARVWTYRLGCVIVVLPSHVLLQTVRAGANLLSVALVESAWKPRLAALGALPLLYLAFLALVIVCEVVLAPILPWLVGNRPVGDRWILSIGLAVIVLPVLPRVLPAIDLLLDVANYHLASDVERRTYHDRIARAVDALVKSGCQEVHVLAHSLGTVLFYDWLKSTQPGTYPIASLTTIGSPLDKFWYIDHGVSRRRADRSGLEAHLGGAWTNYWSLWDPVSGSLARYDGPNKPVVNHRLRGLGPFLACHSRYRKNPQVIQALREGLGSSSSRPAVAA